MGYRQDVYNRTQIYPFPLENALILILPHMLGLFFVAVWRIGVFVVTLLGLLLNYDIGNHPISLLTFRTLSALAAFVMIASEFSIVAIAFTAPLPIQTFIGNNSTSALATLGAIMLCGLQATLALLPIEGRFTY